MKFPGVFLLAPLLAGFLPSRAGPPDQTGLDPARAYRGCAFLSSSVGREIPETEILAFVKACRIDLVVFDFAWITFHWPRTDLKALENLAARLEKAGVRVAAMYRPRALRPGDAKVHYAVRKDGSIAPDHNELCFAHEDSLLWGASWGVKILRACPSIRTLILYNVRSLCHCKFCRGGAGRKHAARFLEICRSRWREVRPGVLVGHVGMGLEYEKSLDLFCPFFPLNRSGENVPVPTGRIAARLKALRGKAAGKALIPLLKVCWAGATRNTTGDLVRALGDLEKGRMGFLLWYYGWIFHGRGHPYDPKKIVHALHGDWKALSPFLGKAPSARAKKRPRVSGNPGWIFFYSKEDRERRGPRLVFSRPGRKPLVVSPTDDTTLISYLAGRVFGGTPWLAVDLLGRNRALLSFRLPSSLKERGIRKAELVLQVGLPKTPPARPFDLALVGLTGSWNERSASWSRRPPEEDQPFLVVRAAPRPGPIRLDVTRRLKDLLKRGQKRFQLALQAARPVTPRPSPAGTGDLQARLLATLPWEKSLDRALEKAKKEKRLVLAWIRAGTGTGRPEPADQVLLALVFTHPGVVRLVETRFVPLSLAIPGRLFTYPRCRGATDPLGRLGTDCGRTKAPALCVSTAGGKGLGSLNRMGTFDPERVYRFLHSALEKAGFLDPGRAGKARDLLERGELEAAEKAFKKLPRPERAYGLSRAAALLGNHELALQKAREAARTGRPPAADARVQEGVILMRLGDFDEAEAALAKALESPRPPARLDEALYYLGCLAWRKKEPEKARSFWKRLVRDKPKSLWALRAKARMSRPGRFGPYENLRSLASAPAKSPEITGVRGKKEVPLRALRYLLETQEKDGSWPSDTEKFRSAVTALSAHALDLWTPSLEGALREEAAGAVEAAVAWLEDYLETQDPRRADSFGAAYILDFLLSRYEARGGKRLEKLVQKAADFLLQGQCPNGAWSYSYSFGTLWRGGFGGWPRTDKGAPTASTPARPFSSRSGRKEGEGDPGPPGGRHPPAPRARRHLAGLAHDGKALWDRHGPHGPPHGPGFPLKPSPWALPGPTRALLPYSILSPVIPGLRQAWTPRP